jgi:hypothetical protein
MMSDDQDCTIQQYKKVVVLRPFRALLIISYDDGWTDGWMEGHGRPWMDGWMDGYK